LRGPTSKGGEGGEEREETEGRGRNLLRRGGEEREREGRREREGGTGLPYHFSGFSAAYAS